MRTIIAGSRTISSFELLIKAISELTTWNITTVISGTASGVDTLGEIWADINNIPVERFPAEWDKYGKKAGPIRNERMAQNADAAVILWDGSSRGTKNMIELATEYDLIRVIQKINLAPPPHFMV